MRVGEVCGTCGLVATEADGRPYSGDDAIDPCLGRLPGVISACCGHSRRRKYAYVLFESGVIVRSFKVATPATESEKEIEDV